VSDDEQDRSAEATSGPSDSETESAAPGGSDEADAAKTDEADVDATRADVEDPAEDPPAGEAGATEDAASKHVSLWPAALMKSPWWMVAAQILIAPLLAAGAIGVHWWLNVPDKIIESPNDQGSKKRKKKPRKPRDRRSRDQNARNDRSPDELQRDWDRYAQEPFDDEPVRPVWARRHQALVQRAVVVARRDAFKGAPEQPRVVLSGTKCRTVRCRFTMRSQYLHALDAVSDALSRLQSDDADVWRSFAVEPRASSTGEDEGGDEDEDEHYVDVTVSFHTDDTDSRSLSIRPEPETDEAAEGEAAEGEAPAGEAPESEAPAGEAPAGEAPAGKAPAP
jgi:hypothetical protein